MENEFMTNRPQKADSNNINTVLLNGRTDLNDNSSIENDLRAVDNSNKIDSNDNDFIDEQTTFLQLKSRKPLKQEYFFSNYQVHQMI